MILHASCIAHRGRGLLILGPSGAGKSTLALEMMAFGATLVADDRTILRREGGRIVADAPDSIRGRIEARGVGIL
ncbi:HPr kinase/phosphatase C-terminal domain-containing protein, partial [Paracoccus sp. PXZ]